MKPIPSVLKKEFDNQTIGEEPLISFQMFNDIYKEHYQLNDYNYFKLNVNEENPNLIEFDTPVTILNALDDDELSKFEIDTPVILIKVIYGDGHVHYIYKILTKESLRKTTSIKLEDGSIKGEVHVHLEMIPINKETLEHVNCRLYLEEGIKYKTEPS